MNDKNHQVLEAADLTVGTANPVSNTAILVIKSFFSPFSTTVVAPPNASGKPLEEAVRDPAARTGGPGFKLALIATVIITVLCGIAVVVMALMFPDQANTIQIKAFNTMSDVFSAGIGALLGLIGGKATGV
jgi:hypothetical protein